jgi:uncharacterized protein (DUF2267 family)
VTDCLLTNPAGQFDALHQLRTLLRGLYSEGWYFAERQLSPSQNAFIARIQDGVYRDPAIDAEQVARAVLALLAARLAGAELEDAEVSTPKTAPQFWPS